MFLKNTTNLDIIGGNIAGLTFAIESLKKKLPFTIYEKHIWDKPCGGGFGDVFLDYLKKNNINIQYNKIKTSTFANKYFRLEDIPFEVYVTKRKHIQEKLFEKIPKEYIKFEQVTKESVKKLSKLIIVASGINGLSKYLLEKKFTNLGKFQYGLISENDFKNWAFDDMLWYVIPEIKGYAWIFPSTDGEIDVGIGGMISKNQDVYLKQFLTYVERNYDVKINRKSVGKKMRSWGIPMWDNSRPKKFFNHNKRINKFCVGTGDSIDSVQIVSAGGIENALFSSISLANSISKENSGFNIDLQTYERDLFSKLPLPSHSLAMRLIDKITQSNVLLNTTLATTKAAFPIVNRLLSRVFYLD